ncbi:MAG: HAD-IIA family hydrolase [Anaerolineae bacterium]
MKQRSMAISKLRQLRSLVIDMDGVLYRGNAPIQGAGEFLQFLRQIGVRFLLLTNNSTLTAAQYVAKLARMGIQVAEEEILTSGEATAMYLASIASPGTKIYLIGEHGVREELEKRGFVLSEDTDVAYVVVGLDHQFDYEKMTRATRAIRGGARFIGTNPDKTFPSEGELTPGAGALLAAIEAATDTAPLIIGKPQPAIFEIAFQKLQAEPKTTAILGDRLDTDILGGRQLGLTTILVLSGVTDRQQLANSPLIPDLVYEDIAALHRDWKRVVR